MPQWPAEEFLRSLAVFSENHAEWAAAEEILENKIEERIAAKKTKKVPWLTSRDVTSKNIKKLKERSQLLVSKFLKRRKWQGWSCWSGNQCGDPDY